METAMDSANETAGGPWICRTCAAHYPATPAPPEACRICEDARQYVGPGGQEWVSRAELGAAHANEWRALEPGLWGIGVSPSVGIGQRALLIETPHGNVLWDCVPMLDGASAQRIAAMGGLAAICLSHPHFYTGMAEWSAALGGVSIHLPRADLDHVTCPSPAIVPFDGDSREIVPGVGVHRLGGHFEGASVLEWRAGAGGLGALLTGDTIQVAPDIGWVSFMRSYPNMIPLPARSVRAIAERAAGLTFDRIYGGWWDRVIPTGAKQGVARSAERYIAAIA